MELEFDTPEIETSGNFEEALFGVSDLSIIFDILRNKMYSNPIKAICREVSCNARDAHREVGTSDKPIQICLPTALDSFLRIKDFGPGISPERMKDVFINYAASTKRNDNVQTGGFGLGAKTPFSYSDTFNIITCVDGIKYNYSCFIDETKLGKLILLNKKKTNDPNGTEIVVPVKNKDASSFEKEMFMATEFWEVVPDFLNKSVEYAPPTVLTQGSCWKIIEFNDWSNNNVYAIVDGIKYPIDIKSIGCDNNEFIENLKRAYRIKTLLYFNVGELVISANREQIYLDDRQNKSKLCIKSKLQALEKELSTTVNKKIQKEKSWWKACVTFNKLKYTDDKIFNLLSPEWNGEKLIKDTDTARPNIEVFSYKKKSKCKNSEMSVQDIRALRTGYFVFKDFEDCLFIYCDVLKMNISRTQALKIFKQNPNVDRIQIISYDKNSNNSLHIPRLIKLLNAEPYGKYFPNYNKNKTSGVSKENTPLYIYEYDKSCNKFVRSSVKEFKSCKEKKILCKLPKFDNLFSGSSPSKNSVLYNQQLNIKNIIYNKSLNTLLKFFKSKNKKVKIFGVSESVNKFKVKELSKGSLSIEKAFSIYFKSLNIDFAMAKASRGYSDYTHYLLLNDKICNKIKDPNSKFLKLANSAKEYKKLYDSSAELILYEKIYGSISESEVKKAKEKINKKFITVKVLMKKYPMLQYFSEFDNYYGLNKEKDVANYINLIDKNKGKT